MRAAGQSPNCLLKSDKEAGRILIDSETTLGGVPPEAWTYMLGNRCALDWVLDQYKEKKPRDPTIREKFDTYRFAEHKEKVIDLLMRVSTVSVETARIVTAMTSRSRRPGARWHFALGLRATTFSGSRRSLPATLWRRCRGLLQLAKRMPQCFAASRSNVVV